MRAAARQIAKDYNGGNVVLGMPIRVVATSSDLHQPVSAGDPVLVVRQLNEISLTVAADSDSLPSGVRMNLRTPSATLGSAWQNGPPDVKAAAVEVRDAIRQGVYPVTIEASSGAANGSVNVVVQLRTIPSVQLHVATVCQNQLATRYLEAHDVVVDAASGCRLSGAGLLQAVAPGPNDRLDR
jgi:hypothetical protein